MKKFRDLPVYFLVFGLIINILMYFYHPVSFVQLMLRSIIVILIFSTAGYLLENVLNSAANEVSKAKKQAAIAAAILEQEKISKPVIDIKADTLDEDELLKDMALPEKDDFVEMNLDSFKRFMDQDDVTS